MGVAWWPAMLLLAGLGAPRPPFPSSPSGILAFLVGQGQGRIEFRLGAVAHTIIGFSRQVTGWMEADPDRPETAQAQFSVGAGSLTTGLSLRDLRMRDLFLEVGRYPTIAFRLTHAARVERFSPTHARFLAEGVLELHGHVRPVTIPVDLELHGAALVARGEADLRLEDFGIPRPTLFFIPATYDVVHGSFRVVGRRIPPPP